MRNAWVGAGAAVLLAGGEAPLELWSARWEETQVVIALGDLDALACAAAVDRVGRRLGGVRRVLLSKDGRQPLLVVVDDGVPNSPGAVVPLGGAELRAGTVRLQFDLDVIRNAPRAVGESFSDDEQATFFDYYDARAGGAPSGIGAVPSGLDDRSDLHSEAE